MLQIRIITLLVMPKEGLKLRLTMMGDDVDDDDDDEGTELDEKSDKNVN